MTPMQRKMYELKQKLRMGQKANQHAVIAERKREKVLPAALFNGSPARGMASYMVARCC